MTAGSRSAGANEIEAVLAARSEWINRLMIVYFRHYARRHFHAVRIARGTRPAPNHECGVIVYSNHPSWWDPVICLLLQASVFARRAGYGPMEAQALGRYGVLRRIGIFGLEPGTRRGAARFLRVGGGILHTPDTVLWVTAEGGFTDPRRRPVRLRPGVAHLLHRHQHTVAIPLALEFPFWNESTPEALARFGSPIAADPALSVAETQHLLTSRLTETMDQLAQDAMTRDPSRFDTMIGGRAGVGGIYDIWRRLQAAARGERAQLDHEAKAHRQPGYPAA